MPTLTLPEFRREVENYLSARTAREIAGDCVLSDNPGRTIILEFVNRQPPGFRDEARRLIDYFGTQEGSAELGIERGLV